MKSSPSASRALLAVLIGVLFFTLYFSLYTVKRYQNGYAHYFDLGIMHQTVYNTFKSLKTGNGARFLTMSDPHFTVEQVKRMSVHNDMFLAALAPFYFLNAGPETLLILQAAAAAAGAWFVFFITLHELSFTRYRHLLSSIFALSYLLYPPLQRATTYELHAVTFAPLLLLAMHYCWLKKKYTMSLICAALALVTKEQVGATIALWAVYMAYRSLDSKKTVAHLIFSLRKSARVSLSQYYKSGTNLLRQNTQLRVSFLLAVFSAVWCILSLAVIIPYFRGSQHFASSYYSYLTTGWLAWTDGVWRKGNLDLIVKLFYPLGFLSLFSPLYLLILLPEIALVFLSMNENMQNIYFHYHVIFIPFLYIAAIEGIACVLKKVTFKARKPYVVVLAVHIIFATAVGSYLWSAMPWALSPDLYPWENSFTYSEDVLQWQQRLNDDSIKVSASGHLAPFFSGREYYYDFSWKYRSADYVVLDLYDVQNGYHSEDMSQAYAQLLKDWKYMKVYAHGDFVVYRKIAS